MLVESLEDRRLLAVVFDIEAELGSGSADYPSITGSQAGRILRDGLPSQVGTPKTFPGIVDNDARLFEAFTFSNFSNSSTPVTVEFEGAAAPNGIFSTAYSDFDPTDISSGYLGDSGASVNISNPGPATFGIDVAAGALFDVVFSEVSQGTNLGDAYQFSVTMEITDVVVQGTAGDDSLILTSTGPNSGTFRLNGGPVVSFSDLTSFTFNSLGGDDEFVIDLAAGNPLPSGQITFQAGANGTTTGDRLEVIAPSSDGDLPVTVLHFFDNSTDGQLSILTEVDSLSIFYSDSEFVQDGIEAFDRLFAFSNADEAITLDQPNPGQARLRSTSGVTTEFLSSSNALIISSGSGADTVNVLGVTLALDFGLSIVEDDANDTIQFDDAPTVITNGSLSVQGESVVVNQDLSSDLLLSLGNGSGTGQITLNAALLTSNIQQSFLQPVVLMRDVSTLEKTGNVTFAFSIDGEFNLTVENTSPGFGNFFEGDIGAAVPLASFRSISPGVTQAGNVRTTGSQFIGGNYSLPSSPDPDVTFESTEGGSLEFEGAVFPGFATMSGRVSTRTSGTTTFNGQVLDLLSLSITTGGPFFVNTQFAIEGEISIEVLDTDRADDSLTVTDTGRLVSRSGFISLVVGDDVTVEPSAFIDSASSLSILTDSNDISVPDPDPFGSTITIESIIASTFGAFLSGGVQEDSFNLIPQPITLFFIDGNDPTIAPGDILSIDTMGQSLSVSPTTITVGLNAPIEYSNIENFDLPNASSLSIDGDENDNVVIVSAGSTMDSVRYSIDGGPVFEIQASSVTVNGLGGNDRLIADYELNGFFTTSIFFNGNGQTGGTGDILEIIGSFETQTLNYTGVSDDGKDGDVILEMGGLSAQIIYTGLEPITAGNAANTILNLPLALVNNATLRDNAAAGFIEIVDNGATFENTVFPNPTNSLTVNLGNQGDVLSVLTLDAAYAASLIINGGAANNDNVTFTNVDLVNTAGRGLAVSEVELLGMTGGEISGNSAVIGAGILINNSTSGVTTTATLDSVTISSNTATGAAANQGGGGVFNNGSDLTITNSTISNNDANVGSGSGGGLFSVAGTVTITGTTFSFNTAIRAGGGIEVIAGTMTLTDSNLINNSTGPSPGNGGGLHSTGAATVTIDGGSVFGNTATLEGGGLWNSATGTMTVRNGTVINANTASGPAADDGGGGIFNNGGTLIIDGTLAQVEITGNIADGAAGSGGGILSLGGTLTATNALIDQNTAVRAGGGIEVTAGTVANLTGVTLDANSTGPTPGNGGGLHITGAGSVTITDSIVSNNVASAEGGGLWNSATGTLNIINTTINDNTASGVLNDQGGGGVFNDGGTLTITGSTISNNVADGADPINNTFGSGGGLLSVAGLVTITGTTFSFNTAIRAGGGIEVIAGTMTLTDSNLINNSTGPSPGNGGGLHSTGAATVTIDGGSVFGNTATLEGGGLWNSATGTMTVRNGTVISANTASGPAADDGGGGIFNNGGTLIIDGTLAQVEITGNIADGAAGSGGGILSLGGTLTVTNALIDQNTAVRAGGGIEVTAGTVANLTGVTLDANSTGPTPGNGGGLHITGAGSVTITDSVVSNNVASAEGGGLWNSATGTLNIINTTINDNTASGVLNDQGGGGVFNDGGTLTITGSTISNNVADGADPINNTFGSGGGLLSVAGLVTITGTTFSFNTAIRAGGGIEVIAGTMTLTDSNLINNSTGPSPGNGGGLHSTGAATVTIDGGSVFGNTATLEGGGLWNSATGTMTVRNGTVINANTASGPAADDGGGGIFNNGGTLIIDGTLAQVEITGNIADGAAGSGGGILSLGGTLTVTNALIDQNTAVRAGGGIEVTAGTVANLTGVTLDANSTGPTPGNGGGLHITGAGSVTITDSVVSNNVASAEGGGLWNSATGTLNIINTTINDNTASGVLNDQGGGGVFNDGGTLTITGSTISNNVADGADPINNTFGSGGGLLSVAGLVTITGTTFSFNTAIRAGGGIEVIAGTMTLTDSNLINNSTGPSPGNGGGLHSTGAATVTIDGGSVFGNTATLEGGGLWNSATGTMTVRNGTVINANTASGPAADDGGGGIFNNGGTLIIDGALAQVEITGNIADGAAGSGGGILSLGGTLTVTNALIDQNTAVRAGGGIEVTAGTVANLTGVTLDANSTGPTPGNGGGLHITGAGSVTITDSVVSNNVASAEGGGLWNSATGTLNIVNTTINDNTASGVLNDQGGGGVFNDGGTLTITGSTISNNQANGATGGSGGGLLSVNGLVTISGTTFSFNTAQRAGGGIEVIAGTMTLTDSNLISNSTEPTPGNGGGLHSTGAAIVTIDGGTVFNNTASQEGGGLWNSAMGRMTVQNGTVISANVASGSAADDGGGGIFNNGGTFIIDGSLAQVEITGNIANGAASNGGGVFNLGAGTMTITNSLINENEASISGGGVFNSATGTTTITGSTIADNVANGTVATSGGGGVFNDGGPLTITGSTIRNNSADGVTGGSGGGLFSVGGLVTISGTTFDLNTANRAGGGIEIIAGTMTLTDSILSNNSTGPTPGNGGGVHITGAGLVTITDSTVSDNIASAEGGGLWNSASGTLNIINTTINNNIASGTSADQGGGGVFNDGGTLTISSSTISNNQANGATGGSGGGLLSVAGLVTISGTTFSFNTAQRAGGGIEVIAGTMTLTDSNLISNSTGPTPGNGGGLHSTGAATVTIDGGTVFNNTASLEGGGLWNSATGTMTVQNGTVISGNTASGPAADDGGGGVFNNGGTLVIDGTLAQVEITGNLADGAAGNGGGVFNLGAGIVTITNALIDENEAAVSGGGVFNAANGTVTITGSSILANTAAISGGGVFNSATGTTTITDTTIAENIASGTAAGNGGGGVFNNGGSLTITGSTISNNQANGATGGSGGGLFSVAGTVNITGTTFSFNTAQRAGGGIEVIAGTMTLTDSNLINNSTGPTPGNGGGLHSTGAAIVTIDGGTVFNNTASQEGGGLWNSATGTMTVQNGTVISGNTASGPAADDGGGGVFNNGGTLIIDGTLAQVEITGNIADGAAGNGGGVFNLGAGNVMITNALIDQNEAAISGGGVFNSATGTMSITNTTIAENIASGTAAGNGGGGVFNNGGPLTITGSTISNNAANGATGGSGGGLFSVAGLVTITGTTFSFNTAQRAGGGIEVIAGTMTLTDSNLINNSTGPTPGNGGGLHSTGAANVTIDGGTVFNNTATLEGGGLWNSATGTMTVQNGTVISGNTASGPAADDGGGGIFNNGGTLVINGTLAQVEITGNIADGAAGNGGGVFNLGAGNVTITNALIDQNEATISGGGVFNSANGTVTISGSSILANTAAVSGGGVFNSATGTTSITDTTIAENIASGTAAANGGGGVFNNGGPLTITGSTISNNAANGATGGSGGGLFSVAGLVTITGTTFSFNTAQRAGGGIEVIAGTMTLTDSNLINNSTGPTPGNGGGLHSTGAATVTIDGGSVFGNTATLEGGGLWNSATGTMTIQNGTVISGNTASGPAADDGGGGVFNNGGTLVIDGTLAQVEITGNIADGAAGNGGGVFNLGAGNVTITNALIDQNEAAISGGGVFNSATGTTSITDTTIAENIASGTAAGNGGGGVFNNGGPLTITGSTISNNEANGVTGGSGGGLFSVAGLVTITGTTFSFNAAQRAGGGVEVIAGMMTLTDSNLINNSTGPTPGNGGGLHSTGAANVTIDGGTVFGNTATLEGGGLWNSATGTMTVQNGTVISGNTASGPAADDGGGGIFNNGGTLVINGTLAQVEITGNIADGAAGNGGGVFNLGAGNVTITNALIDQNEAAISGGGVFNAANGTVTITGSSILANTAAISGGGVFNSATGTMSITNTTIAENIASGTAAGNGGGGVFNNGGPLTITGSTISNNAANGATGGSGGGLFSVAGTVNITGTTFSFNTAQRAGGGIEVIAGTMTLTDSNLINNSTGPTPGNGGGLHSTGAATVTIDGGSVFGNTATLEGGGLWNSATGTMTVRNGTVISGNIASGSAIDDGGGGIFNNGGTLVVNGSAAVIEISGNEANGTLGSGGGILSLGGTTTVTGVRFDSNTASRGGGAVEINNGNATVTGNTYVGATNTPFAVAFDGTNNADSIDINATTVVNTTASRTLTYDGAVPSLAVFALDGNDTLRLTPSPTTAIFIDGGAPVVQPGDSLEINLAGVANPTLTPTSTTAGSLTSTNRGTVTYQSIESLQAIGTPLQGLDYVLDLVTLGFQDGVANTVQLSRGTVPGGPSLVVTVNNAPLYNFAETTLDSFTVNGTSDNETLLFQESTTGLPVLTGPVGGARDGIEALLDNPNIPARPDYLFNGAAGNDSIRYAFIAGGLNFNQTYAIGTGAGGGNTNGNKQGEILTRDVGNTLVGGHIYFTGLEPILSTGVNAGTLTVLGDLNANTIQIVDADSTNAIGAAVANATRIQETSGFEHFDFANNLFNALEIFGLGGSDTIDMFGFDPGHNVATAVRLDGDSNSGNPVDTSPDLKDTVRLRSTSNLPIASLVRMFGGVVNNTFVLSSNPDGIGNVNAIAVPVQVSPSDDGNGAMNPPNFSPSDTLIVDDTTATGGKTVVITSTTIDGITGNTSATADITYGAGDLIEVINLLSANDANTGETVNVRSTRLGTTYNLTTQAGNDIVNLGSTTNTLTDLLGQVVLNGGANLAAPTTTDSVTANGVTVTRTLPVGDTLNLLDQGFASAGQYNLGDGTFNRGTSISRTTFTNVETINLNTGTAANDINIADTTDNTKTTVNSQGGNDDIDISLTGLASILLVNSAAGVDTIDMATTGANSITKVSSGVGTDTVTLNGGGTGGGIQLDGNDDNDGFDIGSTGGARALLVTGGAGADRVGIVGTSTTTTTQVFGDGLVAATGDGADVFDIGHRLSEILTPTSIGTGSVTNVRGTVVIDGGAGPTIENFTLSTTSRQQPSPAVDTLTRNVAVSDRLFYSDASASEEGQYTHTATTIDKAAIGANTHGRITYERVESVATRTGIFADQVTVTTTQVGTAFQLDTNGGNDTVVVTTTGVQSVSQIRTGLITGGATSDIDTVTINTTGQDSVLHVDTSANSNGVTIPANFADGDVVNVMATGVSSGLTVTTGDENASYPDVDTITIAPTVAATPRPISGRRSLLQFSAGADRDIFNVNEVFLESVIDLRGETGNDTFNLNAAGSDAAGNLLRLNNDPLNATSQDVVARTRQLLIDGGANGPGVQTLSEGVAVSSSLIASDETVSNIATGDVVNINAMTSSRALDIRQVITAFGQSVLATTTPVATGASRNTVGNELVDNVGIENVQLFTGAGDDRFTLSSTLPFGILQTGQVVEFNGGAGAGNVLEVLGGAQADRITVGVIDATGTNPVTGGPLAPIQVANVSFLRVDGGGGDDQISNKTLVRSIMDAGEGNDRVLGGDGNDIIASGAGIDSIFGRGFNDILLPDQNFGSNASFAESGDIIDGGDQENLRPGDLCIQFGRDTVRNCETLGDGGATKDVLTWLRAVLVPLDSLSLSFNPLDPRLEPFRPVINPSTALLSVTEPSSITNSAPPLPAITNPPIPPVPVVADPVAPPPAAEGESLFDVNRDGRVTALDALIVINDLARRNSGRASGEFGSRSIATMDMNGDGRISPVDALMIINEISRRNRAKLAAGEAAPTIQSPVVAAPPTPWANAVDAYFADDDDEE